MTREKLLTLSSKTREHEFKIKTHHILILTLIVIFFISCDPTNKGSDKDQKLTDSKLKQDSVAKAIEIKASIEKKKKDSILLIEQDKVIGDIKFGMSKQIAKREIKKFESKYGKTPHGYTFIRHIYIGEFQALQILDFYHENKLYDIIIQGTSIMWDKYDMEVSKQVNLITGVIEEKYGKPTMHIELEPQHKLQDGYTYLINRWDVGKKRIDVRIEDNGTSYRINVEIFLPEIEEKIKAEKSLKEKQSTEKAKEIF